MTDHDNVCSGFVWGDESFDQLNWNNARLYGFILPGRNHILKLFVDYALSNPISNDRNDWVLIPVEIIFNDIVDFKASINMKNHTELSIVCLSRSNKRPSPNGKVIYSDYEIEFQPYGYITFAATEFQQVALSDSEVTEYYDLDREDEF